MRAAGNSSSLETPFRSLQILGGGVLVCAVLALIFVWEGFPGSVATRSSASSRVTLGGSSRNAVLSPLTVLSNATPPSTPTVDSPANGSVEATTNPGFKVLSTDPEGDP